MRGAAGPDVEVDRDRGPVAPVADHDDDQDGDAGGPVPWAAVSDHAVNAEVARSNGAMDAASAGGGDAVPYRGEMERAFGEDFGGVRAHLGQDGPMGEMSAVAAARGDDVAFASAAPDRGEVAHELAHVVQQRRGGAAEVAPLALEPEDSPAEREADAAADAFAAGAPISIGATRGGAVARAIPSNKPKPPPTCTAPEWLARYLPELSSLVRAFLGGARLPAGHPRLTWSIAPGEVAAQVWDRIAPRDIFSAAPLVWDLERWSPGLFKKIDEVRPTDPPDPKKVGEPVGPYEYTPEAAIVIARDLERLISTATTRLGPRVVAAVDVVPRDAEVCEQRDASLAVAGSVVRSHPIDAHVLEIFGIPGTAMVEAAPPEAADPYLDHVATAGPSGLRPVTYEWVDDPKMWSWIRVTPGDASPEEVALTILGDTARAHEVKASPPFFSLPPRAVTQLAPERQDLMIERFESITNPMDVFDEIDVLSDGVPAEDLAGSVIGEEAGLAQAARLDAPVDGVAIAPATATAFIDAPENAERCQAQIALINERFAGYEAPRALAAMTGRLGERRGRLVELTPVEQAGFAALFRAQSGVLFDVAAELKAIDTQATRIRDAQIAANPKEPPPDIDPVSAQFAREVLEAGGMADLPQTAQAKLADVRARRDAAMFDTLDAMLGETRGALRAADPLVAEHGPDGVDANNVTNAAEIDSRQFDLSMQVLEARRRHAAGESSPQDLEMLQLQVRAAQVDARLMAAISQARYVQQRVVGEMGTVANITFQDIDLREANNRLMFLWSSLVAHHKDWIGVRDKLFAQHAAGVSEPGDLEGTIQTALADVEDWLRRLGDDSLRQALLFAQDAIDDAQTAKAVFDLALMIGLTLVTSGVGSMAAGAARSMRLGRLAVAAADIGAQSLTMATLRTAIWGDSFADAFGTELITNAAGFAALRGIAHALPKLKFAKTLSAWKQGDDVWKYVAHGTELTIEAATQAGLQFALAEAESLARNGRFLDEAELKRLAIQGMGMFIGNAVAHRLARPVMNQLSAYGAKVGAPFRKAQVERLSEEVKTSGDPEKARELLREDRALLDEEMELYKRIAADPAELEAFGGKETLDVVSGQAETHLGKVRAMTVEHSAQHHLAEVMPGEAWTGSPDKVRKVRADAEAAGLVVKERLTPDGEVIHTVEADGRTFELREKTPTPAGHEHKPGAYENTDPDLKNHVNPDGGQVEFMDFPDEIEPAIDGNGDWTVKQTIVTYRPVGGQPVDGMVNRAYRRRPDGSVEIELRQIDMVGIPSMTGTSHPIGDSGTRTTAYAQMRQMQQFEIGVGEVGRVTMKEVQAPDTIAQLEAARRRFGLGYDQLDAVLPRTKSIEYAGTPLVQAGHQIKSTKMVGGKKRTMGEIIELFKDKPETYARAKQAAEQHGIKPEDEVWTDFDIEIELVKAP